MQGFQSNVLDWCIINPCVNHSHQRRFLCNKQSYHTRCLIRWQRLHLVSRSNRKVYFLVYVAYLTADECFLDHHLLLSLGFAVFVTFFDTHSGEAILLCQWWVLCHIFYMIHCYFFDYFQSHGFHWHSWRYFWGKMFTSFSFCSVLILHFKRC